MNTGLRGAARFSMIVWYLKNGAMKFVEPTRFADPSVGLGELNESPGLVHRDDCHPRARPACGGVALRR
jgi:hypothetical protein